MAVIPAEEMTVETQKNKLTEYKTIYEGGIGEITEKKSRFIATVRPVETEEDALAFLEEMKKKYWDARHNCYVYSVGTNRECFLAQAALCALIQRLCRKDWLQALLF